MRLTIFGAAALLAGCASLPPPEQIRTMAANSSTYEVCKAMALAHPQVQQIAREEAQRRGEDCRPYWQQMLAEQQLTTNAAAAALMLQQQRPRPQAAPIHQITPASPPPRPINCTSYRIGDQVHTSCN